LDDRGEDADGIASFLDARGSVCAFEKAGEAGGEARADRHGDAITADGGGVNPRDVFFNGEIVDEEAGFEIVGAVEKQIEAGEKFFGILRSEIGDEAFDGNGGVDGAKFLLSGNRFRKRIACVGFVEQRLALKVGRLDEIAVKNAETANAGAGEQSGGGSADGAAADYDGAGRGKALLAGFTNAGEENLARVAFERGGVAGERRQGVSGPVRAMRLPIYDSAKGRMAGNAAVLRFV